MNRNFFAFSWFVTSTTAFVFAALLLVYISSPQVVISKSNEYRLYQALPVNKLLISENINHGDARSLIIEEFFRSRNSPLAEFAADFIAVSDFYQLDFRLLPAISMQESNGGKKVPEGTFNPFGYGIYGSKKVHFDGWGDAIETVGKALREDYLNEGLHNPEQIMAKYTPPSLAKGGAWAIGVNQFMEELR
ncbi:hypothetical protein A2769_01290 [Candidatus Daviesbacteria bacterium RIFCSPHIGHO2_01_FULL_37_27]|nr:MAG: hypothetical protein A2111_03320 [Candidatus Daviesbacteria bacterium GWA1_38_6]OGE18092.1 MAG: hypothetical protein A2769_01290 [Candidatus Daviesbacteria bacterium RIFCSPHIGHO2_01_FULL_37_27]OGE44835.1 MAG: hypothetical protein A3B39_00295 [Candidatus Daviesbacteria bacterium RIFCSPLOWO2_01_FULL_37_10]